MRALDKYFETTGTLIELWEMVQESLVADYSRSVIRREPEATRIQVFTSNVIPGLLQTAGYARELFRLGIPGLSEDELNERVSIRMRRKHIFSQDKPPFFWAIMDETALARPIGGSAAMRAQLRQVLEMAQHPRITVQVLPFAQGGHSMLGGGLTLLTAKDGKTIALIESFDTGEATESPERLVHLNQLFDIASSTASSDDDSLDLVRHYLGEYEEDEDPNS